MTSTISPPAVAFTPTPLTTTFIPSPSCFADYYTVTFSNIDGNGYLRLGPPQTSDCLPPGYDSKSQYFSPGICPSGYTVACLTSNVIEPLTETAATCCPSGYTCQSQGTDVLPWYSSFACTRNDAQFTSPYNVINITATNSIGKVFISTSTISGGAGVNAFGVLIRFQATDFAASTVPVTGGGENTSVVVLSKPDTVEHGLSTGAKVGIGVAVALVLLITLALVFAIFIIRSRKRDRWPAPEPPPAYPNSELMGSVGASGVREIRREVSMIHEMPAK